MVEGYILTDSPGLIMVTVHADHFASDGPLPLHIVNATPTRTFSAEEQK